MTNIDSVLKSRDITLLAKVCIVKAIVFPIVMYKYELGQKKVEHQKIGTFKLWCWRRLFKRPLDSKDIKPVNPKGDQPWKFIGRTDSEAEALILWPHEVRSWLIGKDPDAGKDWRQEGKGMTAVEMIGWHHWLYGHEFEQIQGESEE